MGEETEWERMEEARRVREAKRDQGLLEEFAKAALTGLLANPANAVHGEETIAEMAWGQARVMLDQRPS